MSNNKSSSGIGFFGLLAIAFIILKLCKVIAWKWVWVLAPLWMPIAAVGIGIIIWFSFKVIFNWKHVKSKIARDKAFKEHRQPEKSKWQQRLEEMQQKQAEKLKK